VTQAIGVTNALVVHPSVPARTVKEFIALAKARPGQLIFASSGTGRSTHLSGARAD
jgi:tripartite-type tricarboxylate transporter receptor subunit TctC